MPWSKLWKMERSPNSASIRVYAASWDWRSISSILDWQDTERIQALCKDNYNLIIKQGFYLSFNFIYAATVGVHAQTKGLATCLTPFELQGPALMICYYCCLLLLMQNMCYGFQFSHCDTARWCPPLCVAIFSLISFIFLWILRTSCTRSVRPFMCSLCEWTICNPCI